MRLMASQLARGKRQKEEPSWTRTRVQKGPEHSNYCTTRQLGIFFMTVTLSEFCAGHQPGSSHPCLDSYPAKRYFLGNMSGFLTKNIRPRSQKLPQMSGFLIRHLLQLSRVLGTPTYPSRTVKFSFFVKVPEVVLPERVPSGASAYRHIPAGHFADV